MNKDGKFLYKSPKQIDESNSLRKEEEIVYPATISQYKLDADVILSAITKNQLEESLAKIKYHKVIYEEWGFGEVDKLGRSSILNFYGAPGTGKTLTAEAFAGRLEMPIIKLGIAEIESKMMGETSKNIQRAFKDAHSQRAILFFDEADTLLGKRLSSVTQGVDNEVNAMRSTMLIELEKFDGIVIFATNFAKNYDEAFRSRISYHIEFTLPDLEARIKLWDKMLVGGVPILGDRQELISQCADLSAGFSGREIRNTMRLALPKPILEVGCPENASLAIKHLTAAIDEVKKGQKQVGQSSRSAKDVANDVRVATNLLGVELKDNKDDIATEVAINDVIE